MGDLSGSKKTSSSSSSNQQTTNNNIDRRQVVAEGAIGLSADGSSINVTTLDSGIVNKALDTVASADATNGQGFQSLLTLADRLFAAGGSVLERTADTTLAQVAALNTAQNDAGGKIDQKTIMVAVGVAGAVAIAFAASKGK